MKRHPVTENEPPYADLRPRERVRQYLKSEFERPEITVGCRLPTVRKLAKHLHVSVPTVHAVFQELVEEGRIRTEVGNGTFLISPQVPKSGEFRLALNMHLEQGPGLDTWAMHIGAGILKATLQAPQSIHLMSVSKQIEKSADLRKALRDRIAQVDGMILFPFERTFGLDEEYERAGKLVLHVNPPSEMATENFVAADYFGASRLIGETWRQTGRRNILLLIAPSLQDSISSRLRYAGLVNGLGADVGGEVTLKVHETIDWGYEPVGYRIGKDILSQWKWRPDAIYCGGDLLALGVVRALVEGGVRVPEETSVIGGTGLSLRDSAFPQLTHMHQPCEKIGESLISMMCRRLEAKGASMPGIYLPAPFSGGGTTRPEENAILRIDESTYGML